MAKKSTKQTSLPPLPPKAPGQPPTERYREQYGVIIICPDEDTQAVIYRAFKALPNCTIRVVVT